MITHAFRGGSFGDVIDAPAAWLQASGHGLLNDNAVIPPYSHASRHRVDAEVTGFEANPLDRHASRWLRWRH